MINKLPFRVGDILFNKVSNKFIYIYESKFNTRRKFDRLNQIVEFTFMVIGNPIDKFTVIEPLDRLSLYMTRYGNLSNIDMTVKELESIDINKGDSKEQGLRLEELCRDIKIRFLESY